MKRQYITPSVFCVKLDPKRTFLDGSNLEISNDKTIETPGEGGWAREYNSDDSDNNHYSIWDNAW